MRVFSQMALGHPGKRLLEASDASATAWDNLPDDVVETLLYVAYPWAERNVHQFQALAAWRHVSARHRRIVETRLFAQMRRLPHAFDRTLTEPVVRLFPNMRRLYDPPALEALPRDLSKLRFWNGIEPTSVAQIRAIGATLTHLDLVAVFDFPMTNDDLAALTSLTRLRLQTRGVDPAFTGGQALSTLTRLNRLEVLRNFDVSALVTVTRLGLLDRDTLPNSVTPDVTLLALTRVTHLTLGVRSMRFGDVTSDTLAQLTQLTHLDARGGHIEDDALLGLTRLRTLHTREANHRNETLHALPLETLGLGSHAAAAALELAPMQHLRRLVLRDQHGVSNAALAELTQLTDLEIHSGHFMTDSVIRLTQLRRLVLHVSLHGRYSSSEMMASLGQLQELGLYNQYVYDWTSLTRLTTLEIGAGATMSPYHLGDRLTGLRRLVLSGDARHHSSAFDRLPLLTEVDARLGINNLTHPRLYKPLPPQCLVRSNYVFSPR